MTTLALFLHPGHGTTDPASWRHYFTEPVHVIVLVVAVVGAIALWRFALARERSHN